MAALNLTLVILAMILFGVGFAAWSLTRLLREWRTGRDRTTPPRGMIVMFPKGNVQLVETPVLPPERRPRLQRPKRKPTG